MSAHTLTRTADDGGQHIYGHVLTLRDARQRIAWTCTDNLGMTRQAAAEVANSFDGTGPFTLEIYTFEWDHAWAIGDRVRVGNGKVVWSITGFFGADDAYASLRSIDVASSNSSAHLSRLVAVGT